MLNPSLDRHALAKQFAIDQRICIDNILRVDVAERVRAICAEKLSFDFVYFLDGAVRLLAEQEMTSLGAENKAQISKALMQNATRGIGYLYCGHVMNESRAGTAG